MIERLPSTDIRVEVRRPDRERPGREFALGHAFIRESELDVAIEALITARKQARERKRGGALMAVLFDRKLFKDPKFRDLDRLPEYEAALSLYFRICIHCGLEENDGRLRRREAERLHPSIPRARRAIKVLVDRGVLREDLEADDLVLVGFLKSDGGENRSREQQEEERENWRKKKGLQRKRAPNVPGGHPRGTPPEDSARENANVPGGTPGAFSVSCFSDPSDQISPPPHSGPKPAKVRKPRAAVEPSDEAVLAAVLDGLPTLGPLDPKTKSNAKRAKELRDWARRTHTADPIGAIRRAAHGAAIDAKWADNPFSALTSNPDRYFKAGPATIGADLGDPELAKLERQASEMRSRLEYGEISDPNERIQADEDLARMDAAIAARRRDRKAAA